MKTELVSFIMSVYNSDLCLLEKTIKSVQNQNYQTFEFIIMINSPENDTLCSFLEMYGNSDERIKVFKNERNLGLALSLNEAAKMAKGTYLARIDADDINFPERLSKEVEYIEQNSFDLVGAGIKYIDEYDKIIPNMEFQYYSNYTVSRVLNYIDCIPHPTWLVKKNVFDTIGGYRDIDYCEDYDFLLRAQNRGFKVGLISEELLFYRISSQSLSQKRMLEQLLTSWFLSKNKKKLLEFTTEDIRLSVKKRMESTSFVLAFEKSRDKMKMVGCSNSLVKFLVFLRCALTSEAYRIVFKKVLISRFYLFVSKIQKRKV